MLTENPTQSQTLPARSNAEQAGLRPSQSPAPPTEYAIEFNNVSRMYRLHHEAKLTLQDRAINLFKQKSSYENFWALKDVSFKLEKGKTLGIIGKNGAGKSTLLKLATRILEPTSGTIRVNGRVSAMLELGTGFHGELSARDNIYLNGAFYGFDRKAMDERYDEIVEFSELGKFIDTPVKHFSSGMYMRLGFAVAITVSPDILIIDEVLAVGDAAFSRKCYRAIEDLRQQSKAMVFVSHSAGEVSRLCDEVIYLANGRIVSHGKPGDVIDEYMTSSMGGGYFISRLQTSEESQVTAPKVTKPALATSAAPQPDQLASLWTPPVLAEKVVSPTGQFASNIPLSEMDEIEAEYGDYYRINPGVAEPAITWQFTLPNPNLSPRPVKEKRTKEQDKTKTEDYFSTDYYMAVTNPHQKPVSFEMTGYKRSSSVFDQAVGALRVVPMGRLEIPPHQMQFLRLEEGALSYTNLLRLVASDTLAVELVEYQPVSKLTPPKPARLLSANPSPTWYYPFCDIRSDNRCYFELFNPNEGPVEVSLTMFRDWMGIIPRLRTFICEPHTLLRIDLNSELAGGEGEQRRGEKFYGSVLLEADGPIISERHSLQLFSPQRDLAEETR